MKCKRLLCLLLTVLMLCSLVPETTFADTTVYFTGGHTAARPLCAAMWSFCPSIF